MSADRPDEEIRGWLRSVGMDDTANYAARGRKHRDMSPTDLSAAWVVSFEKLADDFGNADLHLIQNDLAAEYDLRGVEPPYDLVIDAMDRFADGVKAAMAKFTPSDMELLGEKVFEKYSAFKARRDDQKN